jgi:hypothetical protein
LPLGTPPARKGKRRRFYTHVLPRYHAFAPRPQSENHPDYPIYTEKKRREKERQKDRERDTSVRWNTELSLDAVIDDHLYLLDWV